MSYATTVAAVAAVASAGVGTYSAIRQGEQQKEWNNYQAKQAEADAKAEKSAAEVQADKIRKMARIQASEANASLASSGVDVGEGTAVNINKDIYGNAEEDAVQTIFGGADRAARGNAQAQGYRIKGSQAQQAGYLNAASTILATGAVMARGWKTSMSADGVSVKDGGGAVPGYSSSDLGSGLKIG